MLALQKLMHFSFLPIHSFTRIDTKYPFPEMQAETTAMKLSSVSIFSLRQPTDNTLYTFRFIISSVLASEEKTNYLNWDLKFSPILFIWTLTIHLQLLLHIMAGFQLNVFILVICEAYLKS